MRPQVLLPALLLLVAGCPAEPPPEPTRPPTTFDWSPDLVADVNGIRVDLMRVRVLPWSARSVAVEWFGEQLEETGGLEDQDGYYFACDLVVVSNPQGQRVTGVDSARLGLESGPFPRDTRGSSGQLKTGSPPATHLRYWARLDEAPPSAPTDIGFVLELSDGSKETLTIPIQVPPRCFVSDPVGTDASAAPGVRRRAP